jgi:hypothetical protein
LDFQVFHLVTVDTIQDVFSRFGSPPINVVFEESHINNQSKVQSGRGLIFYPNNYLGIQASIEISKVLKCVVVDQVIYNCSLPPSNLKTTNKTEYGPSVTHISRSCIPHHPSALLATSLTRKSSSVAPNPSFHRKKYSDYPLDHYNLSLSSSSSPTFSSSKFPSLQSSPFSSSSYTTRLSSSSFETFPPLDDDYRNLFHI